MAKSKRSSRVRRERAAAAAAVAPAPAPRAAGRQAPPEDFFRIWLPTLVVALFIITFVIQPFDIPSSSMERTLLVGDHLLADRVRLSPPAHWSGGLLPYRPIRHGDIVVFLSLANPGLHLVKRVVGLPGDTIRLEHGVVYRNGAALHEPYTEHSGTYDPPRDDFPQGQLPGAWPPWAATEASYIVNGAVRVPPGAYFVMGDNRDDSFDSRYFGFVPAANILGRPSLVYWSYRSSEADYEATALGDRLADFVSMLVHAPVRTRWGRMLHRVR